MLNVNELKKISGKRKADEKGRQNENSGGARDVKKAANHSCGKGEVKGLCRQKAGDLVNLYLSCKQCQKRNQQAP